VFVEGADRVGGRGKREVVDLERAVGYGGDEEGVVGLGPGDVVDAVGEGDTDDNVEREVVLGNTTNGTLATTIRL